MITETLFKEQSTIAKLLLETEADRIRLIAVKKAVRYSRGIIRFAVALTLASITLVMLAFALAIYLAELFDNTALGYIAAAGGVLVLLVSWMVFGKQILTPILLRNSLKEIIGNDK